MQEDENNTRFEEMNSASEINTTIPPSEEILALMNTNLASWLEAEQVRQTIRQASYRTASERRKFEGLVGKIFTKLNIIDEMRQLQDLNAQIRERFKQALDEATQKGKE